MNMIYARYRCALMLDAIYAAPRAAFVCARVYAAVHAAALLTPATPLAYVTRRALYIIAGDGAIMMLLRWLSLLPLLLLRVDDR